jgi:hypothetical protein
MRSRVPKPKKNLSKDIIKFSGTIDGFSFEIYIPEAASRDAGLDCKISHNKTGIEVKSYKSLDHWDKEIEFNQAKINVLKQIRAMVSSLKTNLS